MAQGEQGRRNQNTERGASSVGWVGCSAVRCGAVQCSRPRARGGGRGREETGILLLVQVLYKDSAIDGAKIIKSKGSGIQQKKRSEAREDGGEGGRGEGEGGRMKGLWPADGGDIVNKSKTA